MRLRRLAVRGLAGAAGAHAGLLLAPATRRWLGPVQVSAAVQPGCGGTQVDLAPLGTATLPTHRGRLRLVLRPLAVDPDRAAPLLQTAEDTAGSAAVLARARADVEPQARALAREVAVRSFAAAASGGAVLGALAGRRASDAAGAALVGGGLVAALAAAAAATKSADAWRDPQLTGLLEKAPLVLGDLRTAPERLGTYRDQLAELLHTGGTVYRRIAELPEPPPGDAIRLVHVSDIHLSPLALPLAKALVEEYGAHAVIDTGDLVDWGTPAETATLAPIAELGVPYVYIKGNHDSAGIARAVAEQPNAVVLDGDTQPVEVAGVRFVGMPDPRFTPDKTTGHDDADELPVEAAREFAVALEKAGTQADIALVHAPAGGRKLAGVVPLVLSGDTHIRAAHRVDDTLVLTQGSSGGAGLRGVQESPPTPLCLSVLHLDRATRALHTIDEITVGGLGTTSLAINRKRAYEL